MASDLTRKQKVLFVVVAALAVLFSVALTLYFTGFFERFAGRREAYQNITFTDATLTCEDRVRDEFGDRMSSMYVDNHSSRYDAKMYAYRIFIQVEADGKKDQPGQHYVNCYVDAGRGKVSTFEVFERKETKTEATTSRSRLLFWPNRD